MVNISPNLEEGSEIEKKHHFSLDKFVENNFQIEKVFKICKKLHQIIFGLASLKKYKRLKIN